MSALACLALLLFVQGAGAARNGAARPADSWSQAELIHAGAAGGVIAASPQDPQGRVYAAWLRNGKVMLATRHAGGWGPATILAAPGPDASALTLAAAPDGRVLAAWEQDGEVYATVAGSGLATDVSRSAKASDEPQATYVRSLGFVVVWRELLRASADDYASGRALVEAHLQDAWTAPAVVYRPTPTELGGLATVAYVGPASATDSELVIPLAMLDTYAVREYATAIVWDGGGWRPPMRLAGGGKGAEGGAGLLGGQPIPVFHDFTLVSAENLATGRYATLVSDPTYRLGTPVAATAGGTVLAAWHQPAGLTVSSSSDGEAWSQATTIVPGGAPVSAAAASGGSIFVAYLTAGGDLWAIHLVTPRP